MSLSPSIVGKLGRAVKGVCSCWDWQLISRLIWLTILLSVATSTAGDWLDEFDDVLDVSYSLPNDCTNRPDRELVQEMENTSPGELSTFEEDIDEVNEFECEGVCERTLSEDDFETDAFIFERFVVDDDEARLDIFIFLCQTSYF